MPLTCRTLWLSDVHLGTRASRAADLLNFLEDVTAERIYLTGDIIDLQRMRIRPRFPDIHRRVVSRLIQLANTGTEVIFIPGNHDAEFRDLAGRDLCGIRVMLEATHQTTDNRRLLITHGDVFDREIRRGTSLGEFGAAAYAMMLRLDVVVNQLRHRLGDEYSSVSRQIKSRLASANEYIHRFEEVAAHHASVRNFDGIVCGHIHRPALRTIERVCYANDGDWVEHRSALAEAADGSLQLLHWERDAVRVGPAAETRPLAA